jgi:hypothetical protein
LAERAGAVESIDRSKQIGVMGMRRGWIVALAVLVLVIVGLGVAGAVWGDSDWGRHGGDVVSRTVAQDGTETIVVREGHHGGFGFFPFGLFFFPLVILFWVFIFRALVFRGPWNGGYRGGPWGPGGPGAGNGSNGGPGWLDEWHRRAHSGDASEARDDRPNDQPPSPATS